MYKYNGIAVQRIDTVGAAIRFRSIIEAANQSGLKYYEVEKSFRKNLWVNGFKFYRLEKPQYRFLPPVINHTEENIRTIRKEALKITRYMKKTDMQNGNSELSKEVNELIILCQRILRKFNRKKNA